MSHQPGLGLEPQQLGGGAGGDDQGIAGVAVLARMDRHGPCAEIDRGDVAENDPGAEALGLLAELVHHVRAHDAVGETGIVLDVSGDGELAPGLGTLHHQRIEVGTGRVEGGGESGRPRTEYDDAVVSLVCHGLVHSIRALSLVGRVGQRPDPTRGWASDYASLIRPTGRFASQTYRGYASDDASLIRPTGRGR